MIRGAVIDWYPYPFLDPAVEPGVGLDGAAVYVIAIASFILLIGSGIVGLSQSRWPYRAADGRDIAGIEHDERVSA